MSSIEVEFIDMRIPHYKDAIKVLKNRGFNSVRATKGTRQSILDNYYKFIVNARSIELGRQHTPRELEEIYSYAKDNVEHYEMYIKRTKQSKNAMRENNSSSAIPPPEMFATNEEVEHMQPNYREFENLSSRMTNSFRTPRMNMPSHGYASSLLLDPQYNIKSLYNYRRTQGYKNNNRNNMVHSGAGKRTKRRNKTHRRKRRC